MLFLILLLSCLGVSLFYAGYILGLHDEAKCQPPPSVWEKIDADIDAMSKERSENRGK